MIGYKDFIVHVKEKHRSTIKTSAGIEIHADSRFSGKETANTVFEVVEIPMTYIGVVKKGFQLMVDPTLVMEQSYQLTGHQENINLIDRAKSLYKVNKMLIICYRENENSPWRGFEDNLIVEKIKEIKASEKTESGLYLVDTAKPVIERGKAKVLVTNSELEKQGVFPNDIVFINEQYVVDIRIDGIKYSWVKDRHVLAVELKEAM